MILGFKGVVGLLAGATVTGFLMAIYMANAGGAWDNAKKYIEAGNYGGKGSDSHKAGVVGDTVGDILQGYRRPGHQHPHQAPEHGFHRVRRADRELFPAVIHRYPPRKFYAYQNIEEPRRCRGSSMFFSSNCFSSAAGSPPPSQWDSG